MVLILARPGRPTACPPPAVRFMRSNMYIYIYICLCLYVYTYIYIYICLVLLLVLLLFQVPMHATRFPLGASPLIECLITSARESLWETLRCPDRFYVALTRIKASIRLCLLLSSLLSLLLSSLLLVVVIVVVVVVVVVVVLLLVSLLVYISL